jgi:hypothetical protein
MFQAYFDESDYDDIFIVAGWVAEDSVWKQFSDDWKAVCEESPRIEYFKHNEAKGKPPKGQFSGWSQEQIESKIAALSDVVCRHKLYGLVTGLRKSTIDGIFSKATMPKKHLRSVLKGTHHFQWCLFSVHSGVLQMQLERGHSKDKVDFIFDETNGLLTECSEIYDYIMPALAEEKKKIFGILTEGNDKQVGALQAADLLAGQMTTNLKLGFQEEHLRKMVGCREIHKMQAYPPYIEQLPGFIEVFNQCWDALQASRAMERRLEELRRAIEEWKASQRGKDD